MRTFGANFIAQKDADFAIPFLIAEIRSPLGLLWIADKTRTVDGSQYIGLVKSWGALGASLQGFGEAFAAPTTTVTILNAPQLGGYNKRFSFFLPRYLNRVEATLWWVFTHPDSGIHYKELALNGQLTDAKWDYVEATVTIQSIAEKIMNRDVLQTIDDPDSPDPNVRRPLPIMVNAADRMPLWHYSDDRSKFAVAEDIRYAATYSFGARYFQGASITEIETSAGNLAPTP